MLGNQQIWVGFKNALIYSVLFTIISVIITLLAAYPMSRSDFRFKRFFNTVYVITMFFGGGLIPTYLIWGCSIPSGPYCCPARSASGT